MTIRITIPFWPHCQALKCHNHPAILGNISQLPTCSNTCQHVPSVCKVSKLTSFQIPASAGYMVQWCWYCQPIYFYIFLYVAMVIYTLHGACWLQALHPSRTVPWVRAAWNISYLGAMGRSEGKVWPDRTGLSLKTKVGGPNNVGKTTITSMTGNGNHTTYKNGDLGDGLLLFYPRYAH